VRAAVVGLPLALLLLACGDPGAPLSDPVSPVGDPTIVATSSLAAGASATDTAVAADTAAAPNSDLAQSGAGPRTPITVRAPSTPTPATRRPSTGGGTGSTSNSGGGSGTTRTSPTGTGAGPTRIAAPVRIDPIQAIPGSFSGLIGDLDGACTVGGQRAETTDCVRLDPQVDPEGVTISEGCTVNSTSPDLSNGLDTTSDKLPLTVTVFVTCDPLAESP
jgi:hypothetical protein